MQSPRQETDEKVESDHGDEEIPWLLSLRVCLHTFMHAFQYISIINSAYADVYFPDFSITTKCHVHTCFGVGGEFLVPRYP